MNGPFCRLPGKSLRQWPGTIVSETERFGNVLRLVGGSVVVISSAVEPYILEPMVIYASRSCSAA